MSRGFKLSILVLAPLAIAYFFPWSYFGPTAAGIVRHVDPPQPVHSVAPQAAKSLRDI